MDVCLAPFSLLLFDQISLVGMLANVLAVPWVKFRMLNRQTTPAL